MFADRCCWGVQRACFWDLPFIILLWLWVGVGKLRGQISRATFFSSILGRLKRQLDLVYFTYYFINSSTYIGICKGYITLFSVLYHLVAFGGQGASIS